MKLPSLKFSLPFIFLCWCIAGVRVFGWVILAYPAMWALVAAFFYGLHVMIRNNVASGSVSQTGADKSLATAAADQTSPEPMSDDSPTDHKISAPV